MLKGTSGHTNDSPPWRLLRVARVAVILDRSPKEVRKLIKNKVLPAVKQGRQYYVKVESVAHYIELLNLRRRK